MTNKIPPQAIDIERAVLGAMLLDKSALEFVELLQTEMFYADANQIVFDAIQHLYRRSQVDMLTVVEHLKAKGTLEKVGGPYYVTMLTNAVVSSAHTESHAKKVIEAYLLRQLIKIGSEMAAKAYDQLSDPFELIESCEQSLHQLTLQLNQNDAQKVDSVLVEVVQELEAKRFRKTDLTGITSGFTALDKHVCGWQSANLIILAARPKCGKTAMALNLALNASAQGKGVVFFSMEMSKKQLVKRLLANKASVYLQTIRDAHLNEEQMAHLYKEGVQKIAGTELYIDDTAALSVAELKTKARRLVRKGKVQMIVVDYLQLLQPERGRKNQNREQEVSTMARQLKIAAKELDVPVICLSQLNRDADGKVPQLSNLRESGAIEQDADMVAFLYKPSVDEIKSDRSLERLVTFKIAAFRDGEPKSFEFDFYGEFQRFEEKGEAKEPALAIGNWRRLNDTDFPGSRNYAQPTSEDEAF